MNPVTKDTEGVAGYIAKRKTWWSKSDIEAIDYLNNAKADLFKILDFYPAVYKPFKEAVWNGQVDPCTPYITRSDESGCIYAWVAFTYHSTYEKVREAFLIGTESKHTPFEKFLFGSWEKATPDDNDVLFLTDSWLEEWAEAHKELL